MTMAEKRTGPKDRISELPRNLIDCILERMSTRDAARTTILSKKWRYIWATHPQLVLDYPFFNEYLWATHPQLVANYQYFCEKNIVALWIPSEYVGMVNKILTVHSGTLQKFDLYIPFSQTPDMDLWMLILSRKGIKELTLYYHYYHHNHNMFYQLPSYIFSCTELTYLNLSNFIISDPPLEFCGFRNLNKLFLDVMRLSPKIGSLISRLPVLHELWLHDCTGINTLEVLPPKLNVLNMDGCHEFQWQSLKIRNLNLVWLFVRLPKKVDQQGEDFNLLMLLSNLPKIVTLLLDGFSLKFLSAGIQRKYLPIKVHDLTRVRFYSFQFNDLEQISCAFCLLRSSPNLQNLDIEACIYTNEGEEEQVVDYMEGQVNSDMRLNHLQTVRLCFFNGLKAEMLFAKLLLSHSPSLERMGIENSPGIDSNEVLRISMELMRFPRASTKAEIIYVPHPSFHTSFGLFPEFLSW